MSDLWKLSQMLNETNHNQDLQDKRNQNLEWIVATTFETKPLNKLFQ